MSDTQMLFYAVLGGFIVNVLRWFELINVAQDERPDGTDWLYWTSCVL